MLRFVFIAMLLLAPSPAFANFVVTCDPWSIGEACTLPGEANQPPRGVCTSKGAPIPKGREVAFKDWPVCKGPNDDIIAGAAYGVSAIVLLGIGAFAWRRRRAASSAPDEDVSDDQPATRA